MATKLTEHFTLEEMTFSPTAVRRGIPNTVDLKGQEYRNLFLLCQNILEPFRAKAFAVATPVHVNSGYRSKAVNKAVGGASKSQHMTGQAADITVRNMTPMAVCTRIIQMRLPFDQLILEFGQWTHVSIAEPGTNPRGEVLTAIKKNGKTKYINGLEA